MDWKIGDFLGVFSFRINGRAKILGIFARKKKTDIHIYAIAESKGVTDATMRLQVQII